MSKAAGPNLDRLSSIKEDGSRNHIHPADVKGRFVTRRRIVYAALIAIYVALPFVQIGGKPAIYLDIAARRFFLFGATFNAQDAWLIFFLITGVGVGLLFLTAWLGRVWCGWACPQTVFLEGVYRNIERLIEGPRNVRIRRNFGPLTAEKAARKGLKHVAFIVVSLGLAHVFLSLFVSLRTLFEMVQQNPREHWVAFLWVMAIASALYFNFAWFREQLCIVICPYGRLQSLMHDNHSLVIGYDARRGEPRGRIKRGERRAEPRGPIGDERRVSLPQVAADPTPAASASMQRLAGIDAASAPTAPVASAGRTSATAPTIPLLASVEAAVAEALPAKGDCIDCNRCVVVCPTGIDIRDGLQMECIGCAQCVDACDEVMIKIGRPTGLIRYDSLAGLAGEKKQTLRPRLFAYGAVLLLVLTGLGVGLGGRNPFEANLLRVQGTPYIMDSASGTVRNQYELHLVNKNPSAVTFSIAVDVPDEVQITIPVREVALGSLESFRLPIFVTAPAAHSTPFDVQVIVTDGGSARQRTTTARFLGPRAGRAQP